MEHDEPSGDTRFVEKMSQPIDAAVGFAFAIAGVAILIGASAIQESTHDELVGARALPGLIAWIFIVGGVGLGVRRILRMRSGVGALDDEGTRDDPGERGSFWRALGIAAISSVFYFALPRVGFYITTIALMPAALWAMKVRRPTRLVGVTLGFIVVVHFGFVEGIGTAFPIPQWLP